MNKLEGGHGSTPSRPVPILLRVPQQDVGYGLSIWVTLSFRNFIPKGSDKSLLVSTHSILKTFSLFKIKGN